MTFQLYHNPRCSKSRAACALLEEKSVSFETVLYLETPPSADELARIIALLGLPSARDLMRTGEAIYKELGLANVSDEQALIAAMSKYPKLIERPILVGPEQAAIGRPTENLLDIL
ncbi:MAG: arsenate reductase (glutaredoxin) [Robiginitomaculum sp.]|nr:arsenate reductase (glutaredoxin) [Robiginitomaculum sp.]